MGKKMVGYQDQDSTEWVVCVLTSDLFGQGSISGIWMWEGSGHPSKDGGFLRYSGFLNFQQL